MVRFTLSMKEWIIKYHPELIVPIMFGHIELFTDEMKKEYLEWCKSDEGKEYLKGGSKYMDDEYNRQIEHDLKVQ